MLPDEPRRAGDERGWPRAPSWCGDSAAARGRGSVRGSKGRRCRRGMRAQRGRPCQHLGCGRRGRCPRPCGEHARAVASSSVATVRCGIPTYVDRAWCGAFLAKAICHDARSARRRNTVRSLTPRRAAISDGLQPCLASRCTSGHASTTIHSLQPQASLRQNSTHAGVLFAPGCVSSESNPPHPRGQTCTRGRSASVSRGSW